MSDRQVPQLDMLPDGTFRQPARPPILTRVFFWASVVAVIAGGLAIAAFLLWIALILVPVALLAGLIAWLAFRFQLWRRPGLAARQRDLWRS
ncbi:MAG TPA: hypothetical protein VFN42_13210 [Acetobacteraceae bacterium]|nr:hypothetical protein [Acetobacteraceae bacterium]